MAARGRGKGKPGRGTPCAESVPSGSTSNSSSNTAELNLNSSALTRMREVLQDVIKHYGQGIKTRKPLDIGETVSGGTLSGTQALMNKLIIMF